MNANLSRIVRGLSAAMALSLIAAAPAAAQTEIVLHARSASAVLGDWQLVSDATAAGGTRMWNPDRGAAKLSTALAAPFDYFELTFTAEAGRPYRLWLRGKADNDYWANDSVLVQFSGAVLASGGAAYRIGTTEAAMVSLEECSGCGSYRWGWNDNGYAGLGPVVYFATTGTQRIRIQKREDGISIDQVVLSASRYLSASPGLFKDDVTILAATAAAPATTTAPTTAPTTTTTAPTTTTTAPTTTTTAPTTTTTAPTTTTTAPTTTTTTTAPTTATGTTNPAEVVIPVASASVLRGDWQMVADSTAATGYRVWNPDRGAAKLAVAAAAPSDYFDITFNAESGRAYRLWIRGRAQNDYFANDSVFVQFSGSLNASGAAAYRIGTTDSTMVSIEQGNGYGLSGWGWTDNGWDALGPVVYFQSTGPQTIRVQRREDGVSIDQIVLSAGTYLTAAPGAAKNDTTLLAGAAPATTTTTAPTTTTTAPTTTTTAPTTTTTEPAPTTTAPTTTTTAPSTAPATGSAVRMRVLVWNLHHGVGTDGVYNIDRIATWIARMNPDVVLLNEVEKFTYWGNEDQPARYKALLEAKTGRTWYSHFSQEYGQWSSAGKGHQILSVYPLDSVNHTTISYSRVVSQATITVNGRTINLFLTHLDPDSLDGRLVQAQESVRWAAGYAENRIMAGDMNAWPDQASIAEFNRTYFDSWDVAAAKGTATGIAGITPFGATRKGRIDYIFFSRGASNLVVLDSATPDTRDASGIMPSDHRPVVTTFEVR